MQLSPFPRLSPVTAGVLLVILTVLAAGAWNLHRQRQEIAALRAEAATALQAQRAAASRESAAGAALSKLRETEAALARTKTDLETSNTQSAARTEELDHLVAFLRSELTAALQTIERMKTDTPASPPAKKGTGGSR